MRAHRLAQDDGTIQVARVTRATHLRPVHTGRVTVSLPHVDVDDIDVVVSSGMSHNYSGPPAGSLHLVDGTLIHLSLHGYQAADVARFGDAFHLQYGNRDDINRSRVLNIENPPPPDFITGGTTRWYRRGINHRHLPGTDTIIHHSAIDPAINPPPPTDVPWDDFVALRVDADTLTGRYGTVRRPITPTNQSYGGTTHSKLVALDATTVAVGGTVGATGGWQGTIHMVQYDEGTDTMVGYGPFLFGAKAAEGDGNPSSGEMFLIRINHERLLAVWHPTFESDGGGIYQLAYKRPLHAQVLTYDTVAHTITATGPLRTFQSGLYGSADTGLAWYPDQELLVLTGLNWNGIGDYYVNSVFYTGTDFHLAARSLLVKGYDVIEGHSYRRVTDAPAVDPGGGYFYVHGLYGAADRLVFVWSAIADGIGGDVMYTKLKVGLTGAGTGSLTVYDEGVLIPDAGASYEIWPHGTGVAGQVALNDTENLGLFEQYLNDYDDLIYRFILCREPA